MLAGSCACGQVRYEIRGDLVGPITLCHCWRCRKHSGSSFGTTSGVKATDLVFLSGEDLLRRAGLEAAKSRGLTSECS